MPRWWMVGFAAWAGALVWPGWRPAAVELLAGAWFMGALALVGRDSRAARAALVVGAFLLGGAAVAVRVPGAPLPDRAAVQGTVLSSSGRDALTRTDRGRLWLQFPDLAPDPGTRLVAWTGRPRRRASLPGEASRRWQRIRSRARPRTVRGWRPIGGAVDGLDTTALARAENGPLLEALATGQASRAPEDVLALTRRTGTRHLLAISGLHIGLISAGTFGLCRLLVAPLLLSPAAPVARALPGLAAFGVAVAYGGLVGWPVSALRATWMVGTALGAGLLARRVRPDALWGMAAFGVVMVAPERAGGAGLMLSFGAVAGMLLIAPRLLRLLPLDTPWPLRWLVGSLAATLGATAGTLPTTAWLFQELSPISPLANLVVAPLVGGVAVPGALLGALAPVWAAQPFVWGADCAIDVSLWVLRALDRPTWAPAVGRWGAVGLALAVLCRRRPLAAATIAVMALGLRARTVGVFSVRYLSIGQGDAALLSWPDGRTWLVDGGPPGRGVLHYLRREGLRRLDAVVISHPHPDHTGGLGPVLAELEVGELWVPRPPDRDEEHYRSLWSSAWQRGVPIRVPGDPTPPGVTVLHPTDGWRASGRARVNEESLVLSVHHGRRRFVFLGDVERQGEARLAVDVESADVVKVAHHGSRTSSTAALVAALAPELAVISCGPDNRFGHPTALALSRWAGAAVLRTDRDGTIEVRSDGEALKIRSWRPDRGWLPLQRRPWLPTPPR